MQYIILFVPRYICLHSIKYRWVGVVVVINPAIPPSPRDGVGSLFTHRIVITPASHCTGQQVATHRLVGRGRGNGGKNNQIRSPDRPVGRQTATFPPTSSRRGALSGSRGKFLSLKQTKLCGILQWTAPLTSVKCKSSGESEWWLDLWCWKESCHRTAGVAAGGCWEWELQGNCSQRSTAQSGQLELWLL